MKQPFFRLRACLAMCALLAFGNIAAAQPVTLTATGGLQGELRLDASEDFMAALVLMAGHVRAIAPADLDEDFSAPYFSMRAPLASVVGVATDEGLRVDHIGTAGGLWLKSLAGDFIQSGTVTLTDFRIDLGRGVIHADLVGDHGVGTHDDVDIWRFAQLDGSRLLDVSACTAAQVPACAPAPASLQLRSLTMTEEGIALLTQGLGRGAGARAALMAIPDFGTVTVSVVPEPASALMMLTGVLALAGLARRRRSASPWVCSSAAV